MLYCICLVFSSFHHILTSLFDPGLKTAAVVLKSNFGVRWYLLGLWSKFGAQPKFQHFQTAMKLVFTCESNMAFVCLATCELLGFYLVLCIMAFQIVGTAICLCLYFRIFSCWVLVFNSLHLVLISDEASWEVIISNLFRVLFLIL